MVCSSGKNKAAASNPVSLRQRILRWCFRLRQLLVASLIALACIAWPQVRSRLPQMVQRPEYLVSSDQITITPAPHWIPENLIDDVLKRAELDQPVSLLDPALSERIAAAFFTHPWIQDVHRVWKSFPASVRVEVTYREPIAIVQGVDGYYPIDRDACLLPGSDFNTADIHRYPVIERISSVPMAGQGQPWGDPSVTGAAQLAAVLTAPKENGKTLWETLDLAAILAPRSLSLPGEFIDPEYAIRTSGGSLILWGRPPGTRHPGELTVAKKVRRLVDYHRDHGSLDDAPDPYQIDIREWDTIHRSRLAGNASARP